MEVSKHTKEDSKSKGRASRFVAGVALAAAGVGLWMGIGNASGPGECSPAAGDVCTSVDGTVPSLPQKGTTTTMEITVPPTTGEASTTTPSTVDQSTTTSSSTTIPGIPTTTENQQPPTTPAIEIEMPPATAQPAVPVAPDTM